MKIIFMGTPDFSVGTLEALLAAGHEVALAVTQPDKPRGRGKSMQFSAVKEAALAHGIEVYQPRRVREEACIEYLRAYEADIIVVVAFGQILPGEVLKLPRYGCINVHASLLPKYRGAAPIQWAVINGETVTGVTTMRMDEGLDTGDMILKEEVPLSREETGGSLFERLSKVGARLCVKTLEAIENGTAAYTPQDDSLATYTTMIKKQLGEIDWKKPAQEIERLTRGLNPWPSAYTYLEGKTLKIWRAEAEVEANQSQDAQAQGAREGGMQAGPGCIVDAEGGMQAGPGCIVDVAKDSITVQAGQGLLKLLEVQLEGKKRMAADAFLRGFQVKAGCRLGKE